MSSQGTINIRGNDYETAASRIARFRGDRPEWSIVTELLADDGDRVMFRASLLNEEGRVIATGHAEKRRAGQVATMGPIMCTETAAIARCLGIAGWNAAAELATAEEVTDAIERERAPQAAPAPRPAPAAPAPSARAWANQWFDGIALSEPEEAQIAQYIKGEDLQSLRAMYNRIKAKQAQHATQGGIPEEWRAQAVRL